MADYKTLAIEDRGAVRIITLNRPELFNSLDAESGPDLTHALEEADREPSVRAMVLTGAGRAYAAGGNIQLMGQGLKQGLAPGPVFAEIGAWLGRTVIALRRVGTPVVCAMNGVASGGGLAWALACDLIVAAKSARFDPAYRRLGVTPDGGSSVLITELIGLKRASQFFLLDQPIDADTALAWGMVNQVVADDQLMDQALALAQNLAQGPATAMAMTKELINRAVLPNLERVLEDERQSIVEMVGQPDFVEGVTAFFERRKPEFS